MMPDVYIDLEPIEKARAEARARADKHFSAGADLKEFGTAPSLWAMRLAGCSRRSRQTASALGFPQSNG